MDAMLLPRGANMESSGASSSGASSSSSSSSSPLSGRCKRRGRYRHVLRRKLRPVRVLTFALGFLALGAGFSWSALSWAHVLPGGVGSSDATPGLEGGGGGGGGGGGVRPEAPALHRTLQSSDGDGGGELLPEDVPTAAMRKGGHAVDHDTTDSEMNQGDYPTDLFSLEERRQGYVVLHMCGMLYMFVALAIVCDEFFVPALTVITEKLEISDDVAGATFMAAGGSAPELFTSVIGVFVSHSNVGIGTIVGSAVFNILFVIGMCAIFSKEILNLTWWPLFRDVSFYIVGLLMLIYFFLDNLIDYQESVSLLLCYASYVTFMKFNAGVERFVRGLLGGGNQVTQQEAPAPKDPPAGQNVEDANKLTAKPRLAREGSCASLHNTLMRNSIFQLMIHTLDPLSDGRFKEKASILHKMAKHSIKDENINGIPTDKNLPDKNVSDKNLPDKNLPTKVAVEVTPPNGTMGEPEEEEDEDQPLSLAWPETNRKRLTYLLILPIVLPLWLTLPDVRRETSKRFFPISFIGSITWIAGFSYLMVWWAHQVGETFWVTEEIMGLTILAAGTSIPDLITSVIVARKGLGDMAVSSSVGSNIFDITVGLPFPWLLYSCLNNMAPVVVSSNGLFCAIVLLFLMLLFVIISIAACKWRMSKVLGALMFLLYFVFLIISVMLEDKILTCPVTI